MGDNEQKLDELTRKLGVQEDELKRANERAELAENKLRDVEQELEAVGENMKQLEISAEKAQEREEKLKDKIHALMERLKVAEARYEYGEGPGHDRRREHAVEGGCGAPEEAQHHSLNGPRRYEYLYICLVDCCKQTVMLIISSVLKSSLLTPNMSVTFIEMLILLNYN